MMLTCNYYIPKDQERGRRCRAHITLNTALGHMNMTANRTYAFRFRKGEKGQCVISSITKDGVGGALLVYDPERNEWGEGREVQRDKKDHGSAAFRLESTLHQMRLDGWPHPKSDGDENGWDGTFTFKRFKDDGIGGVMTLENVDVAPRVALMQKDLF